MASPDFAFGFTTPLYGSKDR